MNNNWKKTILKDKFNNKSLCWLWQVTGKYKCFVGILMIFQVILGVCSVLFAMLFRDLIDQAVVGNRDGFFRAAGLLIGLEAGQLAIGAAGRFLIEWERAVLDNRLRGRLFSCLLHKDYAAVTAVHTGQWITRLTSDVNEVTNGIIGIFPSVVGMLVRMLGALAALFYLEPAFFYILVPVGLLLLFVTSLFRNILKKLHKRIQEAHGTVVSFLQERLENLMIIRVFAMEEQTGREAEQKMKEHKDARTRRSHFSNLCNTGFGVVVGAGYIFCAVYCGYGILQGTLSYGTFTAILQLISQIQGPFANISGILPRYYAMIASAERLMEAETYASDGEKERIPAAEITRFYQENFQEIGVRDAKFSYPSYVEENSGNVKNAVIDHLDLDVRKGEYVAFTGHSGCGKSTLLKLFLCLYPLEAGVRYLKVTESDGSSVEYPLTSAWRGLFAYVPQGNQLMSGTIREIIAFGNAQDMKQEERLKRALEISCADEFVAELEKGMDTLLGERGCGLSEGQMQRIAIARAVFSDRPILILDESTSALDESTEQRLLRNLRQMTDKTVLIITHRPAALQICSRQIDMSAEE